MAFAVKRGVDGLVEGIPGIAFVHGDLFEDDLALRFHLGGIEQEAFETVDFELERRLPTVGGEGEVVERGIVAGEGVVGAAERAGDAVDFADPVTGGAFEHHVFEEMGGAALARGFVGGAGAVDDGGRHHGRALAGEHGHGQAVVERCDVVRFGQAAEGSRAAGMEPVGAAVGGKGRGETGRGRASVTRTPCSGELLEQAFTLSRGGR